MRNIDVQLNFLLLQYNPSEHVEAQMHIVSQIWNLLKKTYLPSLISKKLNQWSYTSKLERDDLQSVAFLSTIDCIKNFDYSKSTANFYTYWFASVNNAFNAYLMSICTPYNVSSNLSIDYSKYYTWSKQYFQQFEEMPSMEDIKEHFNWSEKKIMQILNLPFNNNVIRFQEISDFTDTPFDAKDDSIESDDDICERLAYKKVIMDCCSKLTNYQKQFIYFLFGLGQYSQHTIKATATKFGLTIADANKLKDSIFATMKDYITANYNDLFC